MLLINFDNINTEAIIPLDKTHVFYLLFQVTAFLSTTMMHIFYLFSRKEDSTLFLLRMDNYLSIKGRTHSFAPTALKIMSGIFSC